MCWTKKASFLIWLVIAKDGGKKFAEEIGGIFLVGLVCLRPLNLIFTKHQPPMFAAACAMAREFTHPVIISSRHANDECRSMIGSFVVINEEGWIVTAAHIIKGIMDVQKQMNDYNRLVKVRSDIDSNTALKQGQKSAALNSNRIPPLSVVNCSSWWGWDYCELTDIKMITEIDLAVGRLTNFDKNKVQKYPEFKDPTKPMEQGTSLCKIGFPFHQIIPQFDIAKMSFILPPGSVPPPLFPIEGILTRQVLHQSPTVRPYPMAYLETSSPGLKGQSGGPTFDVHGAIWAIQSQTRHLPLGFGANSNGKPDSEHLKNQYLHVGWGIHAATVTGFLKELGIVFHASTH